MKQPNPKVSAKALEEALLRHPIMVIGAVLVSMMILSSGRKRDPRLEVPELLGRRNTAWRGKGSFGKAPFGKQLSHK